MWRVLVVDDNFINRQLLIEMLAGHAQCDTAGNGREAMEAHSLAGRSGKPYDIILLDIAMPEVDGLDFLKMVRTSESQAGVPVGEGVPIIMITAFDKPFMQAFNDGCDDYILKPVDGDLLLTKMREKIRK